MKKIFLILIMVFVFLLGACSVNNVSAEQNNPIKIWLQNKNGSYCTMNVVDEQTGVNYIVVAGIAGTSEHGIAICPRYNSDVTLYNSKGK